MDSEIEAALGRAAREGVEKIVVGAIIAEGRRVLLLRRRAGDFLAGLDELPSGHVEQGEDVLAALRREVKEETRLEVTRIGAFIGEFDYRTRGGQRARQLNFAVEVRAGSGPVALSEHGSYCWADDVDLQDLNVSPDVRRIVARYWSGGPHR